MRIPRIIFALALLLSVFTVSARQTVEVVWWAGVSSGPANYARDIIEEANKLQEKYNFVMNIKLGAGGAIASQYTLNSLNTKTIAIMGTGDAFFVRPLVFPVSSGYRVEDFQLILPQVSLPFAVVMKKGKDANTIVSQPQVSIGIGGLGTTQHLIALQMQKRMPNMVMVPYSQHTDATKDILGDVLDFSTDFLASVEAHTDLEVFGITGSKSIGKYKTLSQRGIHGLEKGNVNIFMVAPAKMDRTLYVELRDILSKAQSSSTRLKARYVSDRTEPIIVPFDRYDDWMSDTNAVFVERTRGIKAE